MPKDKKELKKVQIVIPEELHEKFLEEVEETGLNKQKLWAKIIRSYFDGKKK